MVNPLASSLLGLGSGGVFAGLALTLVITYRSSGVINFATGSIALYTAYTYAFLRRGQLLIPLPWLPQYINLGTPLGFAPAALLSLLLAALVGGLLCLLVFRPLQDAPPLARAVASLGVLTVTEGLLALRLGTQPVAVDAIFPVRRWALGSLVVLSDRFYLAVTVVALTLVLAAAYKYARFGLATRAAAESQVGAYVSGISPDRVALLNWMASAAIAGVAGILIAPITPLEPDTYTLFIVPALAAAVVGRFKYLVPTVLAGLLIGMLQSLATALAYRYTWLPQTGLAELVPLIVVIVALVVVGAGIPVRGGLIRQQLGHAPRPRSLTIPAIAGTLVGVVALLVTSGTWRAGVIGTFIAAIIGLSLVVVTGYAGQVSLAQLSLAGVAAFTLSGLTESWHIPFPFSPLLASLVATVVGVLVGLPALRLRGLTLGVVTLAFAYAIDAIWFRNTSIVSTDGAPVTQPSIFGLDLSVGTGGAFPRLQFGLLCLAILVAVAWGVARMRMSSLGSAMLAVRANERSAAGAGVNVVRIKILSFAIASFIAGLGGCLLSYRLGVVTDSSFTALQGLSLLSVAYLAGLTSVWGGINAGILASAGIVFVALSLAVDLGNWFPVISGLGLILTLIFHPEGLASVGHAAAERPARAANSLLDRVRARIPVTVTRPAWPRTRAREVRADTSTAAGPALEVAGLTVRYGGVTAVSDVSLRVPAGAVVGLIGPNGAGKTSVIDAITGFAAHAGTVHVAGTDTGSMAPHLGVRAGLARTFQALDLYDDLTVEENVSVAASTISPGERHSAITRALYSVGINELRNRPASDLSQGERQLVSIARASASDPRVLLLDEPAAGLDTAETRRIGERIRDISRSGTGVLLVDHDVDLVLGVCDYVYVLEFGSVIANGTPEDIRADPVVARAYLGTSTKNEEVSG
jgi:sulfate-transporting ATPase